MTELINTLGIIIRSTFTWIWDNIGLMLMILALMGIGIFIKYGNK